MKSLINLSYKLIFSVYSEREPITLMNLKPSTCYHVRVQLSRPGEGGEGDPGPEATMETDCPSKIAELSSSQTLYISIYINLAWEQMSTVWTAKHKQV